MMRGSVRRANLGSSLVKHSRVLQMPLSRYMLVRRIGEISRYKGPRGNARESLTSSQPPLSKVRSYLESGELSSLGVALGGPPSRTLRSVQPERTLPETITPASSSTPSCHRMVVFDKHSASFMGTWSAYFEALEITHLRSPMFFHPDPADLDGLLAYADRCVASYGDSFGPTLTACFVLEQDRSQ